MNRRATRFLLNAVLLSVSLAAGLGISELVLRHFTAFPIHAPMGNRVFDDRLLYRMDSNLAGIDAAGFRNPESYGTDFPRVAAIGDSFTYGYNVSREASWPGRLEAAIGERVYNFGVGGYSLLQYVDLVRMAAEAGSRTIVVGLLPENDMAVCDAAQLTFWNGLLSDKEGEGHLLADFCSLSPDRQRPTARQVFDDFNSNKNIDLETRLFDHSAVGSALRYAVDAVVNRRDNLSKNRFFDHNDLTRATGACADPQTDFIFPVFGTKDFIPGFHKNDLRYFEAFGKTDATARAVFRRAVAGMKHHAQANRAGLVFLIIPGRRRVVSHVLAASRREVTQPDWMISLAASEDRLVAMMREELQALDLPEADALPLSAAAYEASARQGHPHYPCFDGHPLEAGYQALADTVVGLVQ